MKKVTEKSQYSTGMHHESDACSEYSALQSMVLGTEHWMQSQLHTVSYFEYRRITC